MSLPLNVLSERELEILQLVATGASNKEIAKELYISTNTVKVHLRNIFTKIGVNSRTEAAMHAVHAGVVNGITHSDEGTNLELRQPSQSIIRDYSFRIGVPSLLLIIISTVIFFYWKSIIQNEQLLLDQRDIQGWKSLAPMITPRHSFATAVYNNQIFVIGGEVKEGVTNVVEKYDPNLNVWISLSEKPTPVSDIGAALIGGKIYVPGGRLASGKVVNYLEVYNPQMDTWSRGKNLPIAMSGYSIVAFEGKLFIFGGWDGREYLHTVFEYDPTNNSWNNLAPMPTKRAFAGAVQSGNRIYIIGGYDGEEFLSSNESFTPNIGGEIESPWNIHSPLPKGRYGMGVVNVIDRVIVIGGIEKDNITPVSMEFTPLKDEWNIYDQIGYESLTDFGIVSEGGKIFLIGGRVDRITTNKVFSFQSIFIINIPIVR